jgi:hypothetical protein
VNPGLTAASVYASDVVLAISRNTVLPGSDRSMM